MEIALVLLLLVAAVILFATEKYPVDFVAVMVLGAVLVLGLVFQIVTPEEGISGFSNPATITVGAMFVLSAGLQKTGAVQALGRMLIRLGKYPFVLLVLMMITSGVASAFINNTPVVAVLMPLVLAVASRRKISASKLLIPLSYASQFGGVCTLIGTSTNLLVSAISDRAGYGAFSMFEFARLGLIMFGAGIVYFLVAGWWLLPRRRGEQLTENYQLGEYITELRVMKNSPLIGKTVVERKFGQQHDVTVLEILREEEKLWAPLTEPIRESDVLLVRGKLKDLMELKGAEKLEIEPEFKLQDEALKAEDLALIEVLVAPRARVIGQTLAELEFRRRYNLIALAIQRRGQALREKLNSVRLQFGDALLLQGPKEAINKLRADENFIVLEEVEEVSLRRHKVPIALGIIAMVVGLAALNILPIMTTAILGCVLMVATRCLSLDEAYAAIDWKVIFLLAGVLPLGIAMQNSGAAAFIAEKSLAFVGRFGPVAALAMIYLLTAALTECMSNNAAAVLLAPIAISTAIGLGVSPKPFLMAVTFAASTAFATPVGYQTNTMVYNPGGYRFTDFMKVGIPLNLIFWVVAVYFIPQIWPF
jgi:di/tricarboxylate transporter